MIYMQIHLPTVICMDLGTNWLLGSTINLIEISQAILCQRTREIYLAEF